MHSRLIQFITFVLTTTAFSQTNTFPSSGNVGIGTTLPAQALEVNGGVRSTRQDWSYQYLETNGGDAGGIYLRSISPVNNQKPLYIVSAYSTDASTVAGNHDIAFLSGELNHEAELVRIQSSGNVGIGTTNPTSKLQVAGDISVVTSSGYQYDVIGSVGIPVWNFSARPAGWYRIASNGGNRASAIFELKENADHSSITFTVGSSYNSLAGASVTVINHSHFGSATFTKIRLLTNGVYDPQYLDVYVDPHNNDNRTFWAFLKDNLRNDGWVLKNYEVASIPSGYGVTEYSVDDLFMVAGRGDAEGVRVDRNGNVGIGTTNPTQKLSVNGTVRAKEVIVDSGWSDYVFGESYELKALSETEAFIKAEKHLPGIPSAQDVAEHGISVGEMQSKLLAKIEELTLHQIRMEKENAELRQRVQVLESRH